MIPVDVARFSRLRRNFTRQQFGLAYRVPALYVFIRLVSFPTSVFGLYYIAFAVSLPWLLFTALLKQNILSLVPTVV